MRRAAALALLVVASCTAPTAVVTPSATVSPSPSPTTITSASRPRVVATIAFEALLTIVYDRPMKHMLACGTRGMGAGQAGTIDGLESNITSRYYTSSDPDFDEMLGATWEAWLNGDCTAVTFSFVHGIGPGTYPLKVVRVQDQAGNGLGPDPSVVTVTVLESAPPRMTLVQSHGNEVSISFSEAIKPDLAADVSRYRLDGKPLATGATATCAVRTCARVVLRLPATPARIPDTVTVIGLLDTSGIAFAPGSETGPISLAAGQSR